MSLATAHMSLKKPSKKPPANAGGTDSGNAELGGFVLEIWSTTGINLQQMDEFIASDAITLESERKTLQAEREQAFYDYLAGKYDLAEQRMISLFRACSFAGLVPLAQRAARLNKAQKGPRVTDPPDWPAKTIKRAKLLLATGSQTHELTKLCRPMFRKSDDAVRKVLQEAGLLPKRKKPCE